MAESLPYSVISEAPGWVVRWKDGKRADGTFATREQAEDHARSIAEGRVVTAGSDVAADEGERDDDGDDFDRDMDVLFARDAELYRRLAR